MKDFSFAVRALLRTPGFTLTAIVTLALGIGLNTAMFSLINSVLLRPLPFAESGQLVRLRRATPENDRGGLSPADYLALKRAEAEFGQFAAYDDARVSVSEPGQSPELRHALRASADYFNVLQLQPELGRFFRPAEETPGNHRVAVISHALWVDRFAAAPDVLGRVLRIDGEPHEIVGVLPASADDGRVIRQVQVFRPLSFTDAERAARGNAWLNVIGRRHPSLTAAQGDAWIAAFGSHLAADFLQENAHATWHVENLLGSTGNRSGRVIMGMLLGLSGFVLLIACSNLANFLLARTISRAHELAVRAALGASRLRLLRPLFFESLLLALAGGVGALLVAEWSGRWLSAHSVENDGSPMTFPLDWRVLGFALAVSLATALFFGLVPALFATRLDVNHALKSGARGSTASRGHRRLRSLLVVGQFSLAMTLLAGAGFFIRGADNLLAQHFGWYADHVVLGGLDLPKSTYASPSQIVAFHQRALEKLASLPGTESASLSYLLPATGLAGPRRYVIEGRPTPPAGQEPSASYNGISPDYFAVTGTRLLSGRAFTRKDTATSEKVVLINETMARVLFPGANPLGQRLARADLPQREWAEIVGVVADVIPVGVYRQPIPFQVYHPFVQEPWNYATLAVRVSRLAPESTLAPIRAAIASLDPDLPVRDLMPIQTALHRAAADLDMLKQMLGAFAALGLSLAVLGIYGVIARTVAQRTGEIGIRMALGAQMVDVVRLVLGSGLRLAVIGAGLGLLGAFGLARLIRSLMPAMQTNGPVVFAASTATLAIVALLACWLPARRAARVNPLEALRAE